MSARRLGAVAAGVLLLGAGVAFAGTSHPTSISYLGPFAEEEFQGVHYGEIESPRRACEVGRTVKLFRRQGGAFELVDKDRTSTDGIWAGHSNTFISDGKVTVTAARIGRSRTCRSDSLLLD